MAQKEWTNEEIMARVDHTLLKADASWASIRVLCEEAIRFKAASVCVPPTYAARIREEFGSKLPVCVVIGFPLGYSVTAAKVAETRQAISDGAKEVDMVVNLCDVKNGDFEAVTREITQVKEACGEHILKVIIETCYLTEAEKIMLCQCVTEGGADYIKTSTGFGSAGAALEDIKLFRKHIGPLVKIKAAGGIRAKDDMLAFFRAGCHRIGASAAVSALFGETL